MSIALRKAQTCDLGVVEKLDAEVFGDLSYGAAGLRQLFDMFPKTFWVATKNEQIIGFTIGGIGNAAENPEGWILALAVSESMRGRGVGKSLTKVVLKRFDSLRVEKISLTVESTNFIAISIYEDVGFVVYQTEENYFGEGEHRTVMSRRLQK